MGQTYCQCTNNQIPSKVPKFSLYKQQLLGQYVMPDKQNMGVNQSKNDVCLSEIKNFPPKFTDLLMYIFSYHLKYSDPFFPPQNCNISSKPYVQKQKWFRLGQYEEEQLHTQSSEKCRKQSKFCEVFKFLNKNYPNLCQKLYPTYNKKAGIAICYLYINGYQEQVLIDDLIPASKISENVPQWILLMQKAFSKVLGSYEYIEEFTMGQIFTQVTGIPYYLGTQKPSDVTFAKGQGEWKKVELKSFNSFKDALKYDSILYEGKNFKKDTSVFGFRNKYVLSSIKFSTSKYKISLLKFTLQKKQKLSLRINQLNYKYRDQSKQPIFQYPPIFISLFRECGNEKLELVGQSHIFENYLYLNNIFTELESGNYYFYIKTLEEVSRLSLTMYCPRQIKITEVFDRKKCKAILSQRFISKIYPESLFYEQIKDKVFASIHKFQNIIAIYFQDNYPRKKLKLRSNDCFFEDQKLSSSREMELSDVKNKWIIVLVSLSNNKFFHTYFDII